jgi:hypothetical protein
MTAWCARTMATTLLKMRKSDLEIEIDWSNLIDCPRCTGTGVIQKLESGTYCFPVLRIQCGCCARLQRMLLLGRGRPKEVPVVEGNTVFVCIEGGGAKISPHLL